MDRSKIYCCWSNEVEVHNQITIRVDDLYFKMSLFDEWVIEAVKLEPT